MARHDSNQAHDFSTNRPTLAIAPQALMAAKIAADIQDTIGHCTPPGPVAAVRDAALLPERDPARYERKAEVARGGMGRIVAVRDRQLGRTIAIKELLWSHPCLERRFEREIRITARLSHPSIIGVLEAGRWPGGMPFYTMKKVEGRELDALIAQRETLPARLGLLPTLVDVADALGYAHSQHIIHRDLKPANILAGAFGETVVIDWGLAKLLDDESTEDQDADLSGPTDCADALTQIGIAMGTPAYMPPEQARGELVDERADVYALGAILYHLVAGGAPYDDTTATNGSETLARVRLGPPAPLARLQPDAPEDLITIIDKAMARERIDRYDDAGQLAAELKRFVAGKPVNAHRYSKLCLLRRWLCRNRAAVVVGAIMSGVLGVGLGAVAL